MRIFDSCRDGMKIFRRNCRRRLHRLHALVGTSPSAVGGDNRDMRSPGGLQGQEVQGLLYVERAELQRLLSSCQMFLLYELNRGDSAGGQGSGD